MHFMVIADTPAEHSTGNHIIRALEHNGHQVTAVAERPSIWQDMASVVSVVPDVVIWNSTAGYAPPETYPYQRSFMAQMRAIGTPIVFYHLDLFWALDRQNYLMQRPCFQSDLVVTADGGHEQQWKDLGINHHWFPPAVSLPETEPGRFRVELSSDVCFVGSWEGYAHRESKHRHELIRWLLTRKDEKRWDVKMWPPSGKPSIRGRRLTDLYASSGVVVGDSCLVPELTNYWSDRIPETTGRGAFLLHPDVPGLEEQHPHLQTWEAYDWEALEAKIDYWLFRPEERAAAIKLNRAHTIANHTYERRMQQLVLALADEGMLGVILVISPHFDDAVFSCGEFIARQRHEGEQVRVLTIVGDRMDIESANRFEENRQAAMFLGFDPWQLLYSDQKHGESWPSDATAAAHIAEHIAIAAPSMILYPLGIVHPDHVFWARATRRAALSSTVRHIGVYEELPYRVLYPEVSESLARQEVKHRFPLDGPSPALANGGFYEEKLIACRMYESQWSGDNLRCCMAPERIWRVR